MANLLLLWPKLTPTDHNTIEFAVRYCRCQSRRYHGDSQGILLMNPARVIAALVEADRRYQNGTTAFYATLEKLKELMRRCPD
jgi:hypothetical protein